MHRPALTTSAVLLCLAAVTACSSSPDTDDAAATTTTSAAGPASGTNVDAACAALVDLDVALTAFPGADPDAPAPSAADLQDWAARARPSLETMVGAAPEELSSSLDVYADTLDTLDDGTPVDVADTGLADASATIDRWGYDSCRYPTLDVVNTGTELTGVPATLPAGPLSLSFTNDSPPDQAGFVVLVARVADGVEVTAAQVADGSVDFEGAVSSIAAAQPTEASPVGYALTVLEPGRYLVVSPLGMPPEFGATLATEFTVA